MGLKGTLIVVCLLIVELFIIIGAVNLMNSCV